MKEGRPSSTARGAAMLRAAHLLWDDPPKVFADSFAMAFSGCSSEAELRQKLERFPSRFGSDGHSELAQATFRMARSDVIMRGRYVEDQLALAVARSVGQYVILGAGLDSFAYRRRELGSTLRVFEVDHPSTQAWKRNRLAELGVALPTNLAFVSVDFERESLFERLTSCGYRPDEAAYFSWLGVVTYLTRDAIFETLSRVASSAAGTEIAFTYLTPPALLDDENRRMREFLMNTTAAQGEPLRTWFEPIELGEELRKLGFAEVRDFPPAEANARYFAGRADGLAVHACHIMRARV